MPNLLTIKYTSNTSDTKYKLNVEQFCVVKRKLLLSGDIELNPGPQQCRNSAIKECSLGSSWALLTERLCELGLCPLDVGGGGDCFFRSISHQMFGIPDYHTLIRSTAVEYMRSHPEQFIESNTENSWIEYLNNMSRQGTWADALIIQSTADSFRVRICIIESHSNFAHTTTIDPVTCQTETSLSVGHIDEFHYVSTVPAVPNTEQMF